MIATSHVIISGTAAVAAGALTHNPAAAVAVGFATHLICDAIPHIDSPPNTVIINDKAVWDKNLYIFAITDSLLAFLSVFLIWFYKFDHNLLSPFLFGAIGGYLPDIIDVFPLWSEQLQKLPIFKQFHALHLGVHNLWRRKFPMPQHWKLGTITQVVAVGANLLYFF